MIEVHFGNLWLWSIFQCIYLTDADRCTGKGNHAALNYFVARALSPFNIFRMDHVEIVGFQFQSLVSCLPCLPITSAPFHGLQLCLENPETSGVPVLFGTSLHFWPDPEKRQKLPAGTGSHVWPYYILLLFVQTWTKTWTQNHVLNIKLTCTWKLNKDWRSLFLLVKSSLIVLKSNCPMAKWRTSSRSLYVDWRQSFILQGKRMFLAPKVVFFPKSTTNTKSFILWIFLQVGRIRTGHWSPVSKDYVGRVLKSMKLILGVLKCWWKQKVLVDIALLFLII